MAPYTQVIRVAERISMISDIQPSDVKPSNVFVNYKEGDIRFSTVQLGDLGGTIPADSKHAKGGMPVGAPIWSKPEVNHRLREELTAAGLSMKATTEAGEKVPMPSPSSFDKLPYLSAVLMESF
jgi:hypothetical protein